VSDAREALPSDFHNRPVLVVDPGRHTARIDRADADAAGRLAATASHDKTVRLWSLTDGTLLRTLRLPAGPEEVGQARAVALEPTGALVAAGGWTHRLDEHPIYLYDTGTGALRHRITGLPGVVRHLTFSCDGRFLAATLGGGHGLRVFDRQGGWAEAMRDVEYGDDSHGAAFAPDGRLATTGFDGLVRLYPPDLVRVPLRQRGRGGTNPFGIAFSSDGAQLAVGYEDSWQVDVLDGQSLTPLFSVATEGIHNGNLGTVAWTVDGTLLAGGRYNDDTGMSPVFVWTAGGRGARHSLPAGQNTLMSLVPLPGGDLLVAAQDPYLARLTPEGRAAWTCALSLADLRGQRFTLGVSADGAMVTFGYALGGKNPARFDLTRLALEPGVAPDRCTAPPRQQGLPIAGWVNTRRPTLAGTPLPLAPFEMARSLALHPEGDCFVLGTEWSLRAFDARGTPLWRQAAPGIAWAVNVTGDGRLIVAAYGDGTIRWHRMDDGREILAFMPFADRANWVVWTPEGFYAASPGAHGVLRWHVNQPGWQPARDFAVSDIPGFYRPEAIKLVLREMETPRAIGLAVLAEQREKVRLLTNSRIPPGARLHLLAIGVSRYDAVHLRLNFAQQDARDVVNALTSTQEALWVAGSRQYLPDEDASRAAIRRGLETLRGAMIGADDLAIVQFSGHGAMVDGELYLLPRDAQVGDAVALKDSALPVTAFKAELMRIAARGRVLVLLDTCYSGGASLDGRAEPVASSTLSIALAAANISVLTSSSASQISREDARWQNGAFTEAFLEALSAADENHDGLISVTELARYIDRRVRNLTNGAQQPAMELRFDGTLFAVH
jgi:WD40 repeat protein